MVGVRRGGGKLALSRPSAPEVPCPVSHLTPTTQAMADGITEKVVPPRTIV